MILRLPILILAAAIACPISLVAADTPSVGALLATIKKVGPDAVGHREATRAWSELSKADAALLPQILAGLKGANPLAANWIRSAVDGIAERQLQQDGKLPAGDLEKFIFDRNHDPRARRLAFEWLAKVDATAPDRIIPQMLDDPSLELRRDAVARVLDQGAKLLADKKPDATAVYRTALTAARDDDQIKEATKQLKALGEKVDLPRHFGFILEWKLAGPFENTDKRGFAVAYPPEEKIDLAATYEGKGKSVQWVDYTTTDEYGNVDLNKALGKHMGVTAYAMADYVSPSEQQVDLRLGCINANKVWLNGRLLHQAEVYHASGRLDQYISRAALKPGHNTILIKVCQNEQTEAWAQDWKFQFRICDVAGTALLSSERPPTPELTSAPEKK